jgi:hypothetical protein
VRGSVPLIWNQDPNFDYDPPIVVQEAKSTDPFKLHFEEQLAEFDKEVIVDLLQEKGKELKVGSSYRNHVRAMKSDQLKYVNFDVHHHCKTTNYDKLSLLVEKIHKDLIGMGYTYFSQSKVDRKQVGVFRTNCKGTLFHMIF